MFTPLHFHSMKIMYNTIKMEYIILINFKNIKEYFKYKDKRPITILYVFKTIYLAFSILFLFPGGFFFWIMAGFLSDSGSNLYIAYITLTVPFWPITLYFIILLFRKINKHRRRTL